MQISGYGTVHGGDRQLQVLAHIASLTQIPGAAYYKAMENIRTGMTEDERITTAKRILEDGGFDMFTDFRVINLEHPSPGKLISGPHVTFSGHFPLKLLEAFSALVHQIENLGIPVDVTPEMEDTRIVDNRLVGGEMVIK